MLPPTENGRKTVNKAVILVGVLLVLLVAARLPRLLWHTPPTIENLKHFDGAIDQSKQTNDRRKSNLYVRATEALKAGDAGKAEALYREIISKYPAEPDSYNALGTCLTFEKRDLEARTNYMRALDLDAKSVDALYGLGCVAYTLHQSSEATNRLERALQLDPQNGYCHRVLGYVLEELGDTRAAISHYELAISLDPNIAADADLKTRLQALKH